MSMAGRPTWVAAKGGTEQGGYRRHNASMQYSSRDLTSHTKMKVRYAMRIIYAFDWSYDILPYDKITIK